MLVWGPGENGTTVVVEVGQIFTLELDSNPGTGYKWNWAIRPDPALTRLKEEFHRTRSGTKILLGGGGMDIWVFQALKVGSTSLEIEYRRPWENKPPQRRFVLDITIIKNI